MFDNRIIFGDNLLVPKALEQEFCGKVKYIYIDPLCNTGGTGEHYDDGIEHSIRFGLMRDGLDLLHLTIKKMPNTVFTKCEWGHDDYSLQIKNLPKRII